MTHSKIKNPEFGSQIDESRLAWHRYITPITEHYCQKIAKHNYRGRRLAYWGHITQNSIPMLLALKQAGAAVAVGACNVDSTDDATAAFLASKDIQVYGWQGMTQADYADNLALVRAFEADYLCDMGGELIVAYQDKTPAVIGALEATTSGLTLLKQHQIPFPVFDWNSIPLKDRLENRFHVGDGVWPTFSSVTGMSLFGRRVLVIGYGPVGKGIAERARDLGAIVGVVDVDPVRLLEARYHGCETMDLASGLSQAHIVVTATGREGVLAEDAFGHLRSGAILFNAGHSNREIDIDFLYQRPFQHMKAYIDRFEVAGSVFFLLARGSLLNLAAQTGSHGVDFFDHYTAVMLLGITWMFDGLPAGAQAGVQRYPAELEQEIAELSVQIYKAR